jgi:predicted nuclease of predicted toxin-antitoxin system
VNVLLDECVPARLARLLTTHSVTTVQRRGWSGVTNGDLLALAEKEFDLFITVDRKLAEQQDLAGLGIAVVLLRAPTNRLADLRPLMPELLQQLTQARAGASTLIPATE